MKMNFCPHAEKIVDYCLDAWAGKDREEFERHLETCEVCQRELRIEKAVENELSEEFDPGFIENRVRVRLQLWQAQDIRSFWLYTFRVAVSGIAAAIAGFVLIPMLVRFLSGVSPNLSQYAQGAAGLLGKLAPGNAFLAILGVGYVAIFVVSVYSLAQIRR
jgi:anti-sigma factor RsiW